MLDSSVRIARNEQKIWNVTTSRAEGRKLDKLVCTSHGSCIQR